MIESAQANGLVLAGGAEHNDPRAATTAGVGELIAAAIEAGARRVLVGVGGSATTDGGLPAVRSLATIGRLDGTDGRPLVEVCCDVRTTFLDAARVFGPQKGASPELIRELTANTLSATSSTRVLDRSSRARPPAMIPHTCVFLPNETMSGVTPSCW